MSTRERVLSVYRQLVADGEKEQGKREALDAIIAYTRKGGYMSLDTESQAVYTTCVDILLDKVEK
jgi:hypothetical protein